MRDSGGIARRHYPVPCGAHDDDNGFQREVRNVKSAPHRSPKRRAPDVDPIDRSIIEALQRDGRLPFTKLGAAVGLSEAAARQRVQRLLDAGIMQVVAVTNPLSVAERRVAMIGIRGSGPIDELAAAIETLDAVEYLVVTAGAFDLLCEVVVADDPALLALVNQLRSIPGVISTETFIYLDLVKQTYEWGAH
jgi:Lrp/AsnC family transcriptional regulator, regulator for asnA, asnC and gidA